MSESFIQRPRKQTASTSEQFQMGADGFKHTMRKTFKVSQKAWNSFLKQTVITLPPVIGLNIGAKIKNLQVGQATTNNLTSISVSRCKILSIPDMHGQGLRF